MSDYIDTREGWVRHEIQGATPIRDEEHVVMEYQGHQAVAYWLPEVSVPPLPTEPYTVIRAHWKGHDSAFGDVMWLAADGTWRYGNGDRVHAADLAEGMSGFEVLAEPCHAHYGAEDLKRAERDTARAVLERVRQELPLGHDGTSLRYLDEIAREFGVES